MNKHTSIEKEIQRQLDILNKKEILNDFLYIYFKNINDQKSFLTSITEVAKEINYFNTKHYIQAGVKGYSPEEQKILLACSKCAINNKIPFTVHDVKEYITKNYPITNYPEYYL